MAASDLLAECEAAISDCLKSQAYTIAERSQQRARLAELQAFRRELLNEVQAASTFSGQMASVGQFNSPL